MGSTTWGWMLAIVGTLASVAGVVFSWMAWVQASRAKEAARDAADAVRKRSVAQEVLRLAGDAKEFLSAVQQRRAENAISAANSLAHALSIVRNRGTASSADTNRLKLCMNEITSVAIRLNVDGIPADRIGFEDLLILCHSIHEGVCDLAGRMERASEGVNS